jgi:hypothetical protein
MTVWTNLSDVARLAINRMVAVTEKEKKLLSKALDSSIGTAQDYADDAVSTHASAGNPHTQYMEELVDDITPTFGGDLSGAFVYNGMTFPVADGTADYLLQTNGAGVLSWAAQAATAPLTTKGDLYTYTTTDARLGVGTDGYVLTANSATGSGLEWTLSLTEVVGDITPQLGGNLDVNGKSIVSAAGGDISITPDTSGDVILSGLKYPQTDGTAGHYLQTTGGGQLQFAAVAVGSSPSTGYGDIFVESSGVATTFGGSSEDWSNASQVVNFDSNGISSSGITPDHTNDHVTVSNTGPYLVQASLSFSGATSNVISFALFKNNGATQITKRATRTLNAAGAVGFAAVQGLADLTGGDTVELWVQNQGASSDVFVQYADISVT